MEEVRSRRKDVPRVRHDLAAGKCEQVSVGNISPPISGDEVLQKKLTCLKKAKAVKARISW